MDTLSFFVEMHPVGKGRPRFSRNGHRPYTPETTRNAEELVRWSYKQKYGSRKPLRCPVMMSITVYVKLPASRPKRILAEHNVFRPDIDNYIKLIMDALNGLAYRDDAQIVGLTVDKAMRWRDTREGFEVSITPIEEAQVVA